MMGYFGALLAREQGDSPAGSIVPRQASSYEARQQHLAGSREPVEPREFDFGNGTAGPATTRQESQSPLLPVPGSRLITTAPSDPTDRPVARRQVEASPAAIEPHPQAPEHPLSQPSRHRRTIPDQPLEVLESPRAGTPPTSPTIAQPPVPVRPPPPVRRRTPTGDQVDRVQPAVARPSEQDQPLTPAVREVRHERKTTIRPRVAEPRTFAVPQASPVRPAPETVVEVTIGRIEVRAAPGAVPRDNTSRPSPMSLDEYLRRRTGGDR
jgi:hypothetical protein